MSILFSVLQNLKSLTEAYREIYPPERPGVPKVKNSHLRILMEDFWTDRVKSPADLLPSKTAIHYLFM